MRTTILALIASLALLGVAVSRACAASPGEAADRASWVTTECAPGTAHMNLGALVCASRVDPTIDIVYGDRTSNDYFAGYWRAVESDCLASPAPISEAFVQGFNAGCLDLDGRDEGPGYSGDMDDADRNDR